MLPVFCMLQVEDSLTLSLGKPFTGATVKVNTQDVVTERLTCTKFRAAWRRPRAPAPLQSMLHHDMTLCQVCCWTPAAAIGSGSGSGKGITAVGAHVCAPVAGQCHKPAHRGCGGCYTATHAEQRSKARGRKHAWWP